MEKITPLAFDHQNHMDDWLILEKIEDVVVGTGVPYNDEKVMSGYPDVDGELIGS